MSSPGNSSAPLQTAGAGIGLRSVLTAASGTSPHPNVLTMAHPNVLTIAAAAAATESTAKLIAAAGSVGGGGKGGGGHCDAEARDVWGDGGTAWCGCVTGWWMYVGM